MALKLLNIALTTPGIGIGRERCVRAYKHACRPDAQGLNSGARHHHHAAILAGTPDSSTFRSSYRTQGQGQATHHVAAPPVFYWATVPSSLSFRLSPLATHFTLLSAASAAAPTATAHRGRAAVLVWCLSRAVRKGDRERGSEKKETRGERERAAGRQRQAINGSFGARRLMAAWQVLSVASPS
jgi:hypothetical protein